jgi:hypothetical protein
MRNADSGPQRANRQSELRNPQSSIRNENMNRRDFLLLNTGPGGRSAIVSCEQLYMRYVDAEADGTTDELFDRLSCDLRGVGAVRLTDTSWLSCEDLKKRLDAVLSQDSQRPLAD